MFFYSSVMGFSFREGSVLGQFDRCFHSENAVMSRWFHIQYHLFLNSDTSGENLGGSILDVILKTFFFSPQAVICGKYLFMQNNYSKHHISGGLYALNHFWLCVFPHWWGDGSKTAFNFILENADWQADIKKSVLKGKSLVELSWTCAY